eukprot:Hpha_TRINITY_DN27090_c0_g1::TRINITY_DN27090_c0_g1_i1::g.33301::m.33301
MWHVTQRSAVRCQGVCRHQRRHFRPQGIAIPPTEMPPLEGEAEFDREVNDYYRLRLNQRFWSKDLAGRFQGSAEQDERRERVYARQLRLGTVMSHAAVANEEGARARAYEAIGGKEWEKSEEYGAVPEEWSFSKGDRVYAHNGPMRHGVATVLGMKDGLLWYQYDSEGVPMPTARRALDSHGWVRLGHNLTEAPPDMSQAHAEVAEPEEDETEEAEPEPEAEEPEAEEAVVPEDDTVEDVGEDVELAGAREEQEAEAEIFESAAAVAAGDAGSIDAAAAAGADTAAEGQPAAAAEAVAAPEATPEVVATAEPAEPTEAASEETPAGDAAPAAPEASAEGAADSSPAQAEGTAESSGAEADPGSSGDKN